jgi:hypothetical protein
MADMGCDPTAFAMRDGEMIYADNIPEILAQFVAASEQVQRLAGSVDAFLAADCSLDCSACERHLARALGFQRIPRGKWWPPEEVQSIASAAHWPDPATIPPDELLAYWSARRFFELCVRNHLGIELS